MENERALKYFITRRTLFCRAGSHPLYRQAQCSRKPANIWHEEMHKSTAQRQTRLTNKHKAAYELDRTNIFRYLTLLGDTPQTIGYTLKPS